MPVEGGEPKRLTWHPGADTVQGWTPDGKSVLFASARATVGAERRAALLDRAGRRAASKSRCRCRAATRARSRPTARRIAYRMNNSWDEERRNYRGGQNRPIWIVDLKTFDLVSPPWTDSKDIDPVWVGDTVYFISDRDGVANVWSYDTGTEDARRRSRSSPTST